MKKIFLLAITALIWSNTASAQSVAELRWRPYLGCWQLFEENVSVKGQPASPGTIVCVAPFENGVKMTTFVDGTPALERQLAADGSTRPVQEGNCPAAQIMEWSRDGGRLFTQTSIRCAGQPPRMTSGIALMTRGGVWFDVQSIEEADSTRVRIRKYQRTSVPPPGATALSDAMQALAASESQAASVHTLSIEDVIEASGKTSGPAVEAMVAEVGGRFNISSRTLKQLADAGVSRDAIDLMVAKAFPERFRPEQMDRPDTYASSSSSADYYGGGAMYVGSDLILGSRPYPFPLYHDPFYYYYSPYYFSPYYYSLFAYPYYPHRYSNYTTYYYGGPGIAPIVPPGTGVPDLPPGQHGYIVNGRGYVRPQGEGGSISGQPQGSSGQRTLTSPRGVRSRGSSSSSGSDASSSSPSSSSGSSGSSNSGSSGGGGSIGGSGYSGGGDGGGRTAQPR